MGKTKQSKELRILNNQLEQLFRPQVTMTDPHSVHLVVFSTVIVHNADIVVANVPFLQSACRVVIFGRHQRCHMEYNLEDEE